MWKREEIAPKEQFLHFSTLLARLYEVQGELL